MPEPSPFYRQHVALDEPVVDGNAFRTWRRVRTHIDDLHDAKLVTDPQWRAFTLFAILVEIAHPGSYRTQSFERSDTAGDPIVAMARRIEAASKLNGIGERIGKQHFEVLLAHALTNAKWRILAKAFRVHHSTMRRWTITALQRLAAR